jgi:hypothetical protein
MMHRTMRPRKRRNLRQPLLLLLRPTLSMAMAIAEPITRNKLKHTLRVTSTVLGIFARRAERCAVSVAG